MSGPRERERERVRNRERERERERERDAAMRQMCCARLSQFELKSKPLWVAPATFVFLSLSVGKVDFSFQSLPVMW